MEHTLDLIIQETYKRLQSLQHNTGAFTALNLKTKQETFAIFPTIYCGHIITKLKKHIDYPLLKRTCRYILDQTSRTCAWNYWGNSMHINADKKYPDDLDDTSLALSVLITSDMREDRDQIEKNINMYPTSLKMTDVGYDGPFNTWILDQNTRSDHWHDIDIVVQAHILSCLNTLKVDMPGIISFIDVCITHSRFTSAYYDNEIAILYAVTSSYRGYVRETLKDAIIQSAQQLLLHDDDINILDTARLLSCLIILECPPTPIQELRDQLVSHREKWEIPYPLYIECINDDKKEHIGSAAITLALVIEALELYENFDRARITHDDNAMCQSKIDDYTKKGSSVTEDYDMLEMACQPILNSPYITSINIRSQIDSILKNIIATKNIRKLILLPTSVKSSLMPYISRESNHILLYIMIGLAGWATWMYADTIRDGDNDRPDSLSLFTILLSIVHDALRKLNITEKEYSMIASMIGTMEQANYEESCPSMNGDPQWSFGLPKDTLNLRERTSAKSIAASIPLMALLMHAKADKGDIELCTHFFTHFLWVRQLSDDALDWQEDSMAGKRTLVTEWIDQEINDRNASISEKTRVFNEKIEIRVIQEINHNIKQALVSAERMSCFTNIDFLKEVLMPYSSSSH